MNQIIQHFLGYLTAERGLARNSVQAYASDLQDFSEFLLTRQCPSFSDVSREIVLDYLETCRDDRGLEISSIARRLISIKLLYRYLAREHLVPVDITGIMESPHLWHILPDFLTYDEVERLLAVYPAAVKDPLALRNRCIIELLYSCGLRVSECVDLRTDSLKLEEKIVRVFGKGSKERIVPIGSVAIRLLHRYFNYARPVLADGRQDTHLFLSNHGHKLDRERVWMIVKNAAKTAGIIKNIHPHTLRHSFASHLLENGADLRVIQEMLGHADIATTQIYTHIEQNKFLATFRQFHPRS